MVVDTHDRFSPAHRISLSLEQALELKSRQRPEGQGFAAANLNSLSCISFLAPVALDGLRQPAHVLVRVAHVAVGVGERRVDRDGLVVVRQRVCLATKSAFNFNFTHKKGKQRLR